MEASEPQTTTVLRYHRLPVTIRMLVRSAYALLLSIVLVVSAFEGVSWGIVIFLALLAQAGYLLWKDARRWTGKQPAILLSEQGIQLLLLVDDNGWIPWSEIRAVEGVSKWGITKRIKLLLYDPDAWIAQTPNLWHRIAMRWEQRLRGTPLIWEARIVEGTFEEQLKLLRQAHQGEYHFEYLADHLIDD